MDGNYRILSVFNEGTFFSILIPGLFFVTTLVPILPKGYIYNLDFGVAVFFSLSLSFVIGIFSHVGSSVIRYYVSFSATEYFKQLLCNSGGETVQDEIIDKFIHSCINDGIIPKGGIDHMEYDFGVLYQYIAFDAWEGGSVVVRTFHSLRYLCRNMMVLIPSVSVLYITSYLSMNSYYPAYSQYLDQNIFLIMSLFLYILLFITMVKAHQKFTRYTVQYMIINQIKC